MSWWNTVLNTVKDVASVLVPVPRESAFTTIASGAGQFHRPIYDRSREQNDDVSGEGTSQGIAVRITTRARISYELDRFQKNAMLIFVQIQNNLSEGRNMESTNHDVSEVVETFTSFKFEVDIHIDLTCTEVDQKCIEFFQRDFGQYGAVVVMVLSYDGTNGQLSALDGRFSESIILRHLTDDLNLTLLAKPKIYVTEANRMGESNAMGRYSLPLEHHQDVLGLHIPFVYSETNRKLRPIWNLCHNMKEMGNSRDFVSIVNKTVEEATTSNSVFNDMPIELSNNLSKDMILASLVVSKVYQH